MNKILLLFAGVWMPYACAVAQTNSIDASSNLQSLGSGNSMFRSFDNRYKGVKGGLVLFEQYVPGKVLMTSGKLFEDPKVNYDAYNDELLVLRNSKEAIVSAGMVKAFTLFTPEEDSLHFARRTGPDGKSGYFQEIVVTKDLAIYRKHYKSLLEPDYKGAYSPGRNYSEFVNEQKLYVLKNSDMVEIKNKRTFVQLFPEVKKELEEFMKEEKIDIKEDLDLVKLALYLSQTKDN